MSRLVLREAAVLSLFFTLTIAMTWPLAVNMSTAVADPGDPYIMAWALDWNVYALTHGKKLWDATIFFPYDNSLALSENVFGIALFAAPFLIAGLDPITVLNLMMIGGFALTGYAGYLLGQVATRCTWASIIAGIALTFQPWRFTHLPHLQFTWSAFLVLLPAVLIHYARKPTWGRAAIVGLVFLLNGLTNLHWLALGSIAVGVTVFVIAAAAPALRPDSRFWIRLGTAGALATILLIPVLLPYREAQKALGMRGDSNETLHYSGRLTDWRWASPASRVHPNEMKGATVDPERWLFPGFLPVGLALFGLILHSFPHRRPIALMRLAGGAMLLILVALITRGGPAWEGKENAASLLALSGMLLVTITIAKGDFDARMVRLVGGTWLVLGFIGAFGLHGSFHRFLFEYVALVKGIRAPVRWAGLAHIGIALFVALGARLLLNSRPKVQVAVALLLSGLFLAELRAAPIRWALQWEVSPVYSWLRDQRVEGGIVHMPIGQASSDFHFMRGAITHHKPIVNGASGFATPSYVELRSLYEADPIPDLLIDRLEEMNCELVVIHSDMLGADIKPVRAWLTKETQRGRLLLLRRFEYGLSGDFVFATRKANPSLLTTGSRSVDPLGRSVHDDLAVLIGDRGQLYNDQPKVFVDTPAVWSGVDGPLVVNGWATSPRGVREVWIAFENGRVRRKATLGPAPDVDAVFPWYGGQARRYVLELAEHPRGVDRDTDIYAEVIDNEGRVGRAPHFWFTWRDGRK